MRGVTVHLWAVASDDFAEWRHFVAAGDDVATHAEYATLLAAVQADIERRGLTVRRVALPVAEMRRRLQAAGWPNTPDYRAAVLAAATEDT